MVHRLRSGCGRRIHHGRQGQDPRKWDDSFSAFNGVVQQSGMDLARYKGKTVEKWTALIPAASSGETSRYGVLLVYRKRPWELTCWNGPPALWWA